MFFLELVHENIKGILYVKELAQKEAWQWDGLFKNLLYITEYLSAPDPQLPRLWRQDENDQITGEEPQGQGLQRRRMDPFM